MVIKSLFKWMFRFLLVALGVIIIAPIGLFLVLEPNDFKPQITSFLRQQTGSEVKIDGDINLKFWPWVGLNCQDAKILQPAGFIDGNFAKIQKLGLKIPVENLLKWNFQLETVSLQQAEINIIKDQSGKLNLDEIIKQPTQANNSATDSTANDKITATSTNTKQSKSKINLKLAIDNFELTDSTITYQDQTNNSVSSISNLNLTSKDIGTSDIAPIKGSFIFSQTAQAKSAKPIKAKVKLDTHLQYIDKTKFNLNNLTANIELFKQERLIANSNISTDVKADLKSQVNLDNLKFSFHNLQLAGSAKLPIDASKPISFDLKTDTVNTHKLQQILAELSPSQSGTSIVQIAAKPKTNFSGNIRTIIGNININHLIHRDLDFYNLNSKIKVDQNHLYLSPLTANFYQGKLKVDLAKNLQKQNSPIMVKGQVNSVNVKSLLADLNNYHKISGTGNSNFSLTHSDRGISGSFNFNISNGSYQGTDVKYLLASAQSLIDKKPNTERDDKQTNFSSLSATMMANNNVLTNNDLKLNSSEFTANGKGTIDLNSNTLSYRVQAWQSHQNTETKIPLAVKIYGPINDPQVVPDMELYMKKYLERELKDKLQDKIEDKLDIDDKINKEINKGLKKFFKF